MTDIIPDDPAAEVARLREQVLDLGEAVTRLTGQVRDIRIALQQAPGPAALGDMADISCAAHEVQGLPLPPGLREWAALREARRPRHLSAVTS